MSIQRRDFLKATGLTLASTALPTWANQGAPATLNTTVWPIVQGMTDATTTSFVILHPKDAVFTPQIRGPLERSLRMGIVQRAALPGSTMAVSEIAATGLYPEVDHALQLIDGNGKIFDQRVFRTVDPRKPTCRFAVVSCMNDSFKEKAVTMWKALERERPEFVIFVGDSCYADNNISGPSEAEYSRRYAESRSTLAWFRMPRLIPSMATWDDHDYGRNNADRHFPFANFNRSLFRLFWGRQFNSLTRQGFGVGSVFESFGQRFYMMDDRSFRDPKNQARGRHWGYEQTEWLLADIARSKTPSWILSGSQLFGGYLDKESFESNHAFDFKDTLGRLARLEAPVAFVSGDVHFSEIMRIERQVLGYETFEFTSSAMHSFTVPFQQMRARNPRRMVSTWKHNFLLFEVDMSQGWNIRCQSVGEDGSRNFNQTVGIRRG